MLTLLDRLFGPQPGLGLGRASMKPYPEAHPCLILATASFSGSCRTLDLNPQPSKPRTRPLNSLKPVHAPVRDLPKKS